jgi:leucyl-tRNA synthetase
MGTSKKPEKTREQHLAKTKAKKDCMELLKMARIYRERGQKKQAEQFYAALVQVLRPVQSAGELKI